MLTLAIIYGIGNIMSYYALARVGAGTFVVFAQGKTLTTALFSVIMMGRSFSWTKWRALLTLVAGVILFVIPTLESSGDNDTKDSKSYDVAMGCLAEFGVIMLSGFASIYFEKAIKRDTASEGLDIWERNFQLGFHSIYIYVILLVAYRNPQEAASGYFSNWTPLAFALSGLGATGGLLVALSIKYGDSVLKTLAISGSIIYAAIVDRFLLGGPLTGQMSISAFIVVVAIISYTFDTTSTAADTKAGEQDVEKGKEVETDDETTSVEEGWNDDEPQAALVERKKTKDRP